MMWILRRLGAQSLNDDKETDFHMCTGTALLGDVVSCVSVGGNALITAGGDPGTLCLFDISSGAPMLRASYVVPPPPSPSVFEQFANTTSTTSTTTSMAMTTIVLVLAIGMISSAPAVLSRARSDSEHECPQLLMSTTFQSMGACENGNSETS